MNFSGESINIEELKNEIIAIRGDMVEKVLIKATSNDGFISGLYATVTTTENSVQRTYRMPLVVDGSYGKANLYVKKGLSYTVQVDAYGETSPASQSFTASSTARDVDFKYSCDMAPLGVWCEATDGTLLAAADWASSGKTAQSVVVITAEHQFRVGLANVEQSTCAWGGRGVDINTMDDEYENAAVNDFDSKGNTDKIIAALNPGWDGEALTNGTTSGHIDANTNTGTGSPETKGAPAAEACRRYSSGTIGAGKWDLPAFGILYLIYLNKTAINACLTAMSATYAWYISLAYGYQNPNYKYYASYVRAVSAF